MVHRLARESPAVCGVGLYWMAGGHFDGIRCPGSLLSGGCHGNEFHPAGHSPADSGKKNVRTICPYGDRRFADSGLADDPDGGGAGEIRRRMDECLQRTAFRRLSWRTGLGHSSAFLDVLFEEIRFG